MKFESEKRSIYREGILIGGGVILSIMAGIGLAEIAKEQDRNLDELCGESTSEYEIQFTPMISKE